MFPLKEWKKINNYGANIKCSYSRKKISLQGFLNFIRHVLVVIPLLQQKGGLLSNASAALPCWKGEGCGWNQTSNITFHSAALRLAETGASVWTLSWKVKEQHFEVFWGENQLHWCDCSTYSFHHGPHGGRGSGRNGSNVVHTQLSWFMGRGGGCQGVSILSPYHKSGIWPFISMKFHW